MAAAPHGQGRWLANKTGSIACDVLDAWFDPSPKSVEAFALGADALRFSPDPVVDALIEAIAAARGLKAGRITLGAGSSEIIHRVLPVLAQSGPAVIVDPTYSEYPFVLKRAGVKVRSVPLSPERGFEMSVPEILEASRGAGLVVLVNPNNPTGTFLSREQILDLRGELPPNTQLWVDEAYIDYCPPGSSVERDACSAPGLFVVKSLSKAYALSGIRSAYLVCAAAESRRIRLGVPPWIIGTSAQSASVAAVSDEGYYRQYWAETRELVGDFANEVRRLGLTAHHGFINAILVEAPGGDGSAFAHRLKESGLLARTLAGMGKAMGDSYVRIALVERSIQAEVLRRIQLALEVRV